jgi:ABC-2 type transport system ATP-binding protein
MKSAIESQDLTVVIDAQRILDNVSFNIGTGRIVGLLGPSGAGKTTLIRVILGLQKPTSGRAGVLGFTPGSPAVRPHVGYVSQSPSVYADLTVAENIYYFGTLLGVDKSECSYVLEQVELTQYTNRIVGSLSGGQRARVSLATALLGSPKVLLLDEPTVGLDPLLRQNLWGQFKQLADAGTTLLVSSHVMDEADQCDELLFIRNGALLAAGPKHVILQKTKSRSMEEAFIRLSKEPAL